MFDECWGDLFTLIVFSVPEEAQRADFVNVFGRTADLVVTDAQPDSPETSGFLEFSADLPVCSYTAGIAANNVGYTQGTAADGTPFVAELSRTDEQTCPAVMLPWTIPEDFAGTKADPLTSGNMTGLRSTGILVDEGVLDVSMADLGPEEDLARCTELVDRIESYGLVSFTGDLHNGMVLYRLDLGGREVARIIVTLRKGDRELAATPLRFRSFPVSRPQTPENIPFPRRDASPKEPAGGGDAAHPPAVRLDEARVRVLNFSDVLACELAFGCQVDDYDELGLVMRDGTVCRTPVGADAVTYHQGVDTATLLEIWPGCPVAGDISLRSAGTAALRNAWYVCCSISSPCCQAVRQDLCDRLTSAESGSVPRCSGFTGRSGKATSAQRRSPAGRATEAGPCAETAFRARQTAAPAGSDSVLCESP